MLLLPRYNKTLLVQRMYLKKVCKLMVLKIKTVTYEASEYRICLKYLGDLRNLDYHGKMTPSSFKIKAARQFN